MNNPTLAPHESMELHEALNFKTICLAKSKLMQGLVFNQELKALMQKDVIQSTQQIAELQAIKTAEGAFASRKQKFPAKYTIVIRPQKALKYFLRRCFRGQVTSCGNIYNFTKT